MTSIDTEKPQGIFAGKRLKSGVFVHLPKSVQEIADVIGREPALYLIGQLPTCKAGVKGHQSTRVILYVPKRLKPHHRLVAILGQERADKLVEGFGGETLQVANCQEVYRRFRDREARRMAGEGVTSKQLAEMLEVTERHIRNLTRGEIPQGALMAANDDTAEDSPPLRSGPYGPQTRDRRTDC